MRIPRFTYYRPSSLEEVCSLLDRYGEKAKLFAGGTDLFVKMKKKEILPEVVISLNGIEGLDKIEWTPGDGLRIGSCATYRAILEHPSIREKYDFLGDALYKIGTRQIRNMGTLVGNLCNASPSSDGAPPLMVLEARLRAVSLRGERIIPIDRFFAGPFKTVLQPQELVVEIQVPPPPPLSAGSYQHIYKASSAGETLVGVSALVALDPDRRSCREVRISLCSVAPTPIRARKAESVLTGKDIPFDDSIIEQAARTASEETQPRSRAWYRREMSSVLVKRALRRAQEKIDEKGGG